MKEYKKWILGAVTIATAGYFLLYNYNPAKEEKAKVSKLVEIHSSYVDDVLERASRSDLRVYCFEMPGGLDGAHPGVAKGKGLNYTEIFSAERASGKVGKMPSLDEMHAVMSAINPSDTLASGRKYCGYDENGSGDLDAITKRGISQYQVSFAKALARVLESKK